MNTSSTTSGAPAQVAVHNVTAVIMAVVNATVAATSAPVLTSAAAVVDATTMMPNLSTGINATVDVTMATSPGINNASMLVVPAEPSLFAGFNLTDVWCDCVHIDLGSKSIVFDSMDLTFPLWTVFCTCVYIYACAFHQNDDGDDNNTSTAAKGWRRKKRARKNKKKMRSLSKNMRFRQWARQHIAYRGEGAAATAYHHTGGLMHTAASKFKEA